jgi:hypothetical protein
VIEITLAMGKEKTKLARINMVKRKVSREIIFNRNTRLTMVTRIKVKLPKEMSIIKTKIYLPKKKNTKKTAPKNYLKHKNLNLLLRFPLLANNNKPNNLKK